LHQADSMDFDGFEHRISLSRTEGEPVRQPTVCSLFTFPLRHPRTIIHISRLIPISLVKE
jgi:hypothetical protein